jgi:phosphoribosyl 1,2-cyclic phosphodiesterase
MATSEPHGSGGMTIQFWGTRGSIPTPGRHTEKYGGNTTCLELRYQDTLAVFDAGSGIRSLGLSLAREFAGRPIHGHLLFTHVHWDHIQGFPFFAPAYREENAFTVYGDVRPDGGARELLDGQMRGSYFPIPLSAMRAALTFRDTAPQFDVGPLRIRTAALPHPGGCLGYRVEVGGGVFVLATDCELDQAVLNADEVSVHPEVPRRHAPRLLDFFRGANLLVIDCQYTDADYSARRGWGHNSLSAVVDLCRQARPNVAALFHHDPESSDEKVTALVDEVRDRLTRAGAADTLVLGASERMVLQV